MYNRKKFYFFNCIQCGAWYYTWKKIKTKKCWNCGKSFKFKDAKKFSKLCTTKEAIALSKELKKKGGNQLNSENLHFYSLNYE
ncbi:MAG: DUF1922 domain-containing protein [Candidatus Lokiarchaeota archaeon]